MATKQQRNLALLTLVATGFLFAGCQSQQTSTVSNPTSSALSGANIVATVNGDPITADQFYDQMQHWTPSNVANFPQNPILAEPAGRVALQELIENTVVMQIAKANGVQVTQDEIESAYNDSLMLQEANYTLPFDSLLSQQGFTPDQFKQEVLAPRIAQQNILLKSVTITPDELQASYNETIKNYRQPNRVHIHRIVAASQDAANKIYQGLKSGKMMSDFSTENMAPLAVDGNSADASDIPRWISLDNQSPSLGAIYSNLRSAKIGDILPPTQVQGQWWVIQLVDKKDANTLPFSQVQDIVKINLINQKSGTAKAQMSQGIQQYLQSATITVNLPQYQSLAIQLKTPTPIAPTAPPVPGQ